MSESYGTHKYTVLAVSTVFVSKWRCIQEITRFKMHSDYHTSPPVLHCAHTLCSCAVYDYQINQATRPGCNTNPLVLKTALDRILSQHCSSPPDKQFGPREAAARCLSRRGTCDLHTDRPQPNRRCGRVSKRAAYRGCSDRLHFGALSHLCKAPTAAARQKNKRQPGRRCC